MSELTKDLKKISSNLFFWVNNMSELGRELGRLLRESIQGLRKERRNESARRDRGRMDAYLGSKGLRRYLIFCGWFYYPEGGWDDFRKDTDSLDEAIRYCNDLIEKGEDWCHIVDTHERKIIRRFEK